MKNYDQAWRRLTAAAREAADHRDSAAPYGFATRVATQAMARPFSDPRLVFEKFAIRGLIAAGAFSLLGLRGAR